MQIQTPQETNHEIITTKRYTFSLASDTDVEKSCFFHVDLKLLINIFKFFCFMNTFLKAIKQLFRRGQSRTSDLRHFLATKSPLKNDEMFFYFTYFSRCLNFCLEFLVM